jgi:anti-sigma B factor antagonist
MRNATVSMGNPVVAFAGELDLSVAESMRSALQPGTDYGGAVTIDLSKVTFMDSTGIRALLDASKAIGDRGCIIVHGAHGSVRRVLELANLAGSVPNMHVIACDVLAQPLKA